MANDIDKTSPHYKGDFGSIYEVNKKFPTGGVAGDFVVIEGWAHYWNADRASWCVNAERDSYWDELITNFIEKFKLIRGGTYMGVASLDTVPAKVIGAKMYYFATVAGTYKNFGDLVVPQGINVLYSENGSSWVNTTLLEVAQELGVSTKKVVSQKAVNDALNLKANQSSVNEALAKKADKETVNTELAKKFDKESVVQESGEAEDKVMSQKAVSDKLSDLLPKEAVVHELGESKDKVVSQFALPFREIESPEFIKIIQDAEGHILFTINLDGEVDWSKGIPAPIRAKLQEIIKQCQQDKTDLTKVLMASITNKVDKEEGMSLIDDEVKACFTTIENEEYLYVKKDKEGKVLEGITRDGIKVINLPLKAKMFNEGIKISIPAHNDCVVKCERFSNNPLGVNINVKYIKETDTFLKYAQLTHVSCVRLEGLSSYVALTGEYGFEVLVNDNYANVAHICEFDVNNKIKRDVNNNAILSEEFKSTLQEKKNLLMLFDGEEHENLVSPFDKKPIKYKMKYYNSENFFGTHYEKYGWTLEEVFVFYKEVYSMIKSIDKNILVLSGSLGTAHLEENKFVDKLCALQDSDGTHFWDYIDIFDFQSYQLHIPLTSEEISKKAFKDFNTLKKKYFNRYNISNLSDKHVWITEYGNSSYDMSNSYRASSIARHALSLFSYGVDKVFLYTLYTPEDLSLPTAGENFFGIVPSNLSASYISFFENDGKYNTPISEGDALKKVFITNSEKLEWNLTRSVYFWQQRYSPVDKMVKKGLAISGKGFTIKKVSIFTKEEVETILWEGTKRIENNTDVLILDKSKFNVDDYDKKIVVYFSQVDSVDTTWKGFKTSVVFDAFQFFAEIYNSGSTKPTLRILDGNIYVASWINGNGIPFHSLWLPTNRHDESFVKAELVIDEPYEIYDCMGNKIPFNGKITGSPIFVKGSEIITLKNIRK